MKFMLSLHDPIASQLVELAKKKNCSIQDFIRVIIIPEWREAKMNGLEKREKRE